MTSQKAHQNAANSPNASPSKKTKGTGPQPVYAVTAKQIHNAAVNVTDDVFKIDGKEMKNVKNRFLLVF